MSNLDGAALLLHAGVDDADSDAGITEHQHEEGQQEEDKELLIRADLQVGEGAALYSYSTVYLSIRYLGLGYNCTNESTIARYSHLT